MKKSISLSIVLPVAILVPTLFLAGCASKQQTGAAIGAGAGALLGHQFGGGRGNTLLTIAGAIGGAMAGSMIGKRMDQNDRTRTAQALEYNSTGETSTWTNPDTGARYAVTPTNTTTQNGNPCRSFVFKSYNANGQPEKVTRVACRQSDGTWQIQQ